MEPYFPQKVKLMEKGGAFFYVLQFSGDFYWNADAGSEPLLNLANERTLLTNLWEAKEQ